MLNMLEFEKIMSGVLILSGLIVILTVLSRRTAPQGIVIAQPESARRFRFRPGTWTVWGLQVLAMYATCLCRSADAFVVEWREAKQECLDEHLKCEE